MAATPLISIVDFIPNRIFNNRNKVLEEPNKHGFAEVKLK